MNRRGIKDAWSSAFWAFREARRACRVGRAGFGLNAKAWRRYVAHFIDAGMRHLDAAITEWLSRCPWLTVDLDPWGR